MNMNSPVQIIAPVESVGDLSSEDDGGEGKDVLSLQPRSVSFSDGPKFRPRRQLSLAGAEVTPSADRRREEGYSNEPCNSKKHSSVSRFCSLFGICCAGGRSSSKVEKLLS